MAEYVAQRIELVFVDEAHACLGDFAFEDTLVAGVAEEAYVHGLRAVEEILEGDVVDEVLREVLVGVGIGGVVASDHNLYTVVEERLRHLVAVARGRGGVAVDGAVVLVDAERHVHALDVVGRPGVDLRLEEGEQGVAADGGVAMGARAGVHVVEEQGHGLVGSLLGAHGPELVAHGDVVVGGEVEGHLHLFEGAGDAQLHVEVDEARVLSALCDVGLDNIHGSDAQRGIHHIAVEGNVAVGVESEELLADDRIGIACETAVDVDAACETPVVVHRRERVSEFARGLQLHLVLAVGREVDAHRRSGRNRQARVDVHEHRR